MTNRASVSTAAPQPRLSMFDVYSGYVLTPEQNALMYAVMWERIMRWVAIASLVVVAAFWLMPGAATGAAALSLKLVLSVVLGGMALLLLSATRGGPRYECQIDLIHGEVRQVIRAASGIEKRLLCVTFALIEDVIVRADPESPEVGCLFMRIAGLDEPVLLGIGSVGTLNRVRGRFAGDLAKSRQIARRADGEPRNGVSGGRMVMV